MKRLRAKQHIVIATAVLAPLVVGLFTLGALTVREAQAHGIGKLNGETKFIKTVTICLNGRRLY